MKNTQKAELRKIARQVEVLRVEAEIIMNELDEYISDHQDTLDGTERGEKLDNELEAVFALEDTFEMLKSEIEEITE